MLHRQHADRALEPHDRNSGEAVEPLLAGLRLVGEGGMLGRLGEVKYASLSGYRANQALTHVKPSDVHRFLSQPVGREELEVVFAQQVDRTDVAIHLLRNEVDDLVELALRRPTPRHDRVESGEDLTG